MSLINDALKRASNQRAAAAAPPAYAAAPLQPAEDAGRSSGPLPIILCIVGVGSLAMAGAFWLKSKGTPPPTAEQHIAPARTEALAESEKSAPPATAPTQAGLNPIQKAAATLEAVQARADSLSAPVVVSAPAATVPSAPPSAVQAPRTAVNEIPPAAPAATAATISPSPAPALAQPVQVAAHESPALPANAKTAPATNFHLQAIYFRMKGPTVVINGKTLKVGDTVNGGRLIAIERTTAELEIDGVRQRLTMR